MMGLRRLPSRFVKINSILLITLLQVTLWSKLGLATATSKLHLNETAELHRSTRCRHLLRLDLHQVDEKNVEEQVQEENQESQATNENQAHEENQEPGKIIVKDSETQKRGEEINTVDESKEAEELTEEQPRPEMEPKDTAGISLTEEKEAFVYPEPYLLGPTIKDWDRQRAAWLENNPHMRSAPDGNPRLLIVTGSQPLPCRSPIGDNFHLKSLKIKMDYARTHNFEIYYNFVWLDPLFGGYWVKLPTIRKLMLTHPEVEWFFWVDSDAVFTDLLFEIPFQTYEAHNMVMWGMPDRFYSEKNWVLVNAGVFLLRNCQWSLDLIDKWSPMGPEGPVRDEVGKMLSNFLGSRGENFPADDQSALAYLMLTDDAVNSRIKLVQDDYKISGYWVEMMSHYEEAMEKYHPGLGDIRWPFITHFTGCSPCSGHNNPDYPYEMCMDTFNRAFNFADNQVLAFMGFQHESLSSPEVIRTRNETDQPLEFLTVNPWAERIVSYQQWQRTSSS